jgi:hypothetical protein
VYIAQQARHDNCEIELILNGRHPDSRIAAMKAAVGGRQGRAGSGSWREANAGSMLESGVREGGQPHGAMISAEHRSYKARNGAILTGRARGHNRLEGAAKHPLMRHAAAASSLAANWA